MSKVCILNYGSGNVKSVFNILQFLNLNPIVSNSAIDIANATHIILPGVGAFGASMEKIAKNIPVSFLETEVLIKGKPFLGICVGMQVLASEGFEFGQFKGLDWIPGVVSENNSMELPKLHIGWNNIEINKKSPLLSDISEDEDFYFVHSYSYRLLNEEHLIATSVYGNNFPAIIQKDNLFGVQFHPEKSQKAGQKLLLNFIKYT